MNNELIKIGFISKPFGFNGELKCALEVNLVSNTFPDFLWIYIDGKPVPYFIENFYYHNNSLILKFEDLSDEISAYEFKNTSIYCVLQLFNKFFEKEENLDDLIGFNVEDNRNGEIGEVVSVIENTIQPTLVLNFNNKEILIPYSEDIILEIDETLKLIKINAPEGLIDLYLQS